MHNATSIITGQHFSWIHSKHGASSNTHLFQELRNIPCSCTSFYIPSGEKETEWSGKVMSQKDEFMKLWNMVRPLERAPYRNVHLPKMGYLLQFEAEM